jgi:hypothetical protein
MVELQDYSTSWDAGLLGWKGSFPGTSYRDQQYFLVGGRHGDHSKGSPIEIRQEHCSS